VEVIIGTGRGPDRQRAELTVLPNGSIWLTFLGHRLGQAVAAVKERTDG